MIHKEGYPSLLIASILCIIFSFFAHYFLGSIGLYFMLGVGLFFIIFFLQFFRNPKRNIPTFDDQLIYAPADGKIVVIEEIEEPEYFKDKRLMISVFMNPLNVHVNRAPYSGEVSYTKYHKGKYLAAWHPKSSTENERNTVVIKNGNTEVLLRQIAGALARRIVGFVKPGDKLKQGEDFGFIKLGSRVDIFLPIGTEVLVEKEQKVKGKLDIIAKLA